jgi:hypothetical protein
MSIAQLGLTGTPSKQYSVSPKRAATTVTKSIGTSSRDYSTMTAWEADLDNTLVYVSGDDAVGECYNDSTFDESVTIDGGGTVGLNSGTITVAAGERHDGTAGTGARLIATTTRSFILSSLGGSLKWLELDGNSTYIVGVYCVGGSSNYTVSNLIVHSVKRATGIGGFQRPGNIHNNIVYDIYESLVNPGADFGCGGISFTLSSGVIGGFVYNNTVYNIVKDNGDGTSVGIQVAGGDRDAPCRNNIAVDVGGTSSGTVQCFNLSTTGTISNNLSSDTSATGTGSITNAVTADQFVSIVSGSEDLHLKAGADAIGAGVDLGTTPDGVQYDIDGFDRDAANRVWDIGADQAAATVTKTIGTTARDYSTMTLWEADLDLSTVYQSGDDAVGECYNDSDFNETVIINGGTTVGLSSRTLTAADGEKHDGTAGSGVRILRTAGAVSLLVLSDITGDTKVEWLEIDLNGNYCEVICSMGGNNAARTSVVANMILHGDSIGTGIRENNIRVEGSYCTFINNLVYDLGNTGQGYTGALRIIETPYSNSNVTIANNTVFNCSADTTSPDRGGITVRDSTIIKNNICVDTANADDFIVVSGTGTATDYNLSSDTSAVGVNSLVSKTSTNQFVSIVSGSEDLHLKAGADAIGAGVDLGTTPAGVEVDIDGRDRDAEGDTWSIGADQFVEILYRHFFTRLGLRATPQAYWFWEGSRTVSEEEEGSKGKNFFIFFY